MCKEANPRWQHRFITEVILAVATQGYLAGWVWENSGVFLYLKVGFLLQLVGKLPATDSNNCPFFSQTPFHLHCFFENRRVAHVDLCFSFMSLDNIPAFDLNCSSTISPNFSIFWDSTETPELFYRLRMGQEGKNIPFFLIPLIKTSSIQTETDIFSTSPYGSGKDSK